MATLNKGDNDVIIIIIIFYDSSSRNGTSLYTEGYRYYQITKK